MNLKINIIDEIKKVIYKTKKLFTLYTVNHPHNKYKLDDMLPIFLNVLETGVSWRKIKSDINYQSLIYHFNRLCKYNVFKRTYNKLLTKYLKIIPKSEYLITDTTLIKNNQCISKYVSRNKLMKHKKCFKVSSLVDINGIPLHIIVGKGSIHDICYLKKHIKQVPHVFKNLTVLADSAYDSKNICSFMTNHNCEYITDINIRNTKDVNKIRTLSDDEKIKYKKRIIVENSFCWLKKNKRISEINEKTMNIYTQFIYLAFIKIITNRLKNV